MARDWFFFDLVGTLIRGAAPIGEQYARHAAALGVEIDPGVMDQAFHAAFRAAPRLQFSLGGLEDPAVAERDWWRHLVARIVERAGLAARLSGDTFDRYFDHLYHHFTTREAWEAYPDAIPALTALQREGYGLGLVTNYDTRVHLVLDALGLSSLLESVVVPAYAGATKPSPVIFEHALKVNGIALGSDYASAPRPRSWPAVFHIGDSLEDDYVGAAQAGLAPILLDRDGRYRNDTDLRRIESLAELLG